MRRDFIAAGCLALVVAAILIGGAAWAVWGR